MIDEKSIKKEYVEAFVPDTMKLAVYVKQAKGPQRTMAEFAEVCGGVSASTFSRIVNHKITRPLSVELIVKIINNAANPDEIDVEGFMRANGMVLGEEQARLRAEDGTVKRRFRDEQINHSRTVRNIIAEELYDRDCTLRFYPKLPQDELPQSSMGLRSYSSFAIHIQGYEPKYWNFQDFHVYSPEDSDVPNDDDVSFYAKRWLDGAAQLFLRDMWEPETLMDVKNSFVFTDSKLYAKVTEMIRTIKVNTDMSLILIDTEKQRVVEEKAITRYDARGFSGIFEQEKTSVNYDDDI